jgi:hypothetical protein
MRAAVAITVIFAARAGLSSIAYAGPIDTIARVAKARDGSALTLTFDAAACTLTATAENDARIPLKKVAWSMTKETDGTNDAVVTVRCKDGSACVASGKAQPRYSFRLATGAREARSMLKDLKALSTKCK